MAPAVHVGTQVSNAVLQACPVGQSAVVKHSTQRFVATSQTLVAGAPMPPIPIVAWQSPLTRHCTQTPLVVSQTPPMAVQLVEVHAAWQRCAVVQMSPVVVQSVLVKHCTQALVV